MKLSLFVAISSVVTVGAFTPAQTTFRTSTSLSAGKSLFRRITDMDLFAPNEDQNDYGARGKKNLKTGAITEGKSYVPSGLTAAQYTKLRKGEVDKKAANYQRNVAKAGKFIDFTEWYIKRGTDVSDGWIKSANRGHDMVKTKFDWSGETEAAAPFSKSTKGKGKGKGKK